MHLGPCIRRLILLSRSRFDFPSRPIQRVQHRPGEYRGRDSAASHCNADAAFGGYHTRVTRRHACRSCESLLSSPTNTHEARIWGKGSLQDRKSLP